MCLHVACRIKTGFVRKVWLCAQIYDVYSHNTIRVLSSNSGPARLDGHNGLRPPPSSDFYSIRGHLKKLKFISSVVRNVV